MVVTEKSGKRTIAVACAASADLTGPRAVQVSIFIISCSWVFRILVGNSGFCFWVFRSAFEHCVPKVSPTKPVKLDLCWQASAVLLDIPSGIPRTLFQMVVGSELPRIPASQPLSPAGARSYVSITV